MLNEYSAIFLNINLNGYAACYFYGFCLFKVTVIEAISRNLDVQGGRATQKTSWLFFRSRVYSLKYKIHAGPVCRCGRYPFLPVSL